jgi:hypothetical protein
VCEHGKQGKFTHVAITPKYVSHKITEQHCAVSRGLLTLAPDVLQRTSSYLPAIMAVVLNQYKH